MTDSIQLECVQGLSEDPFDLQLRLPLWSADKQALEADARTQGF